MSTFCIFTVNLLGGGTWRCSRKFMEIYQYVNCSFLLFPSSLQCRCKQTPTISLSPSPVGKLAKHRKHWTPYVKNIFALCNRQHFCLHYFLYLIGFFHFMCGLTLLCSLADAQFLGNVPDKVEMCCLMLDHWDCEKLMLVWQHDGNSR